MGAVRTCDWSVDEFGTGLDDAVALATVLGSPHDLYKTAR